MSYNRDLVAERLEDLRKPGGKTISLQKLSKEIEEKTGVYISATQLNKYENVERTDVMNVENLIAIADYYNVSYDYLLGCSDSKVRKNIDINERTGLSDKAIHKLENWVNIISKETTNGFKVEIVEKIKAPSEISRIIESNYFVPLIYYIDSLKYIEDNNKDPLPEQSTKNPILGKSKVEILKSEIGKNETREYIMFLIQKTFEKIVNEIVPYSDIEETRKATQADIDDFFGNQ